MALVNGEIAEDLTAYFYISEQQNTSVALGVKVERDYSIGAAGGMIIQMLPGGSGEAVDLLEDMLSKMRPLTAIISDIYEGCKGMTQEGLAEKLLSEIFKDMPEDYRPEILETRDISWQCDCSRERIEKALMTIGKKDLTEIIEEDGKRRASVSFLQKKI